MSLLCGQETFIPTKFTLRPHCQESLDTALVGKDLWHSLTLGTSSSFVCLCLERLEKRTCYNPCDRIVCWAELVEKLDNIAIPPSWHTMYSNIFRPDTFMLQIALYNPLPLREVIFTALSSDAYKLARTSPTSLEAWFSAGKRILRCRTTYEVDLPEQHGTGAMLYRLESSAPVLQGYVEAGFTNLVVTFVSDVRSTSNSNALQIRDLPSDFDGFEIDEDFLANYILSLPPCTLPTTRNNKEQLLPSINCFLPIPRCGHPCDDNNDTTLYVRTSDLIRLGVLDGDWLLASGPSGSKKRLVNVRADDQIVERTGAVVGSPVLLRNICFDQSDCAEHVDWIVLHPSRPQVDAFCLPLAQCVTVTPIASPLAMNRALRSLFLQRLKEYFEVRTRLIKQGDIIAIALDTDEDYLAEKIHDKAGGATSYRFPFTKSRSNEAVFFRVANVVLGPISPSVARGSDARCLAGELGCRVDTLVTRVIQKGAENSLVPYLDKDSRNWNDDSFSTVIGGSIYDKLSRVARAALVHGCVNYDLRLSILLEGPRRVGKYTIASEVARSLGMHLLELNCYEMIGESEMKANSVLRSFEQASSCAPCMLILRRLEAFQNVAEDAGTGWPAILEQCFEKILQNWTILGQSVVIVGTTSEPRMVPLSIRSQFKYRISCKVPNDRERRDFLKGSLATVTLSPDVSVTELTKQTAALDCSDLLDLSTYARLSSFGRCIALSHEGAGTVKTIPLDSTDFEKALKRTRASYSGSIGAPSIPQVYWDDVGGLASVKADIMDTIQLPLEHPEIFADGLRKRSGVLLYGPPGTGKTLIAKAVATTFSLNFLSVKGPELLDMYIGESEANVRKVFQRARDAAPCVIFFDELDSIAPRRGNHGDSGGVMDRIVSQLLAELDGVATADVDIFVIGATNRPDLLDSALLRPGRFDKTLYLGISNTHDAQVHILQALTRKFRLEPGLDLSRLARKCAFSYTGADFYALCSDAMLIAMSRKANEIEKKINALGHHEQYTNHPNPVTPQYYLAEMAKQEEMEIIVTESDLDLALKNIIPSVSQVEMGHYMEMRKQFLTTLT